MDEIARSLESFVRQYRLPARGGRVLVACSGGADSMALLHALADAADSLGIVVGCAHYEHGLRGAESVGDMDFVRRQADARGLRFHVERLAAGEIHRRTHESLQAAARRMRYSFLERIRQQEGYDHIALAHTADDQIETVFFKICRGTSLTGLAGMAAMRDFLIRPLLGVSRTAIESWLVRRGFSWREDSSNASDDYTRNRLRHHVLPELGRLFPGFGTHLAGLARQAGQENAAWDALAVRFGLDARDETGGFSFSAMALAAMPGCLVRRVLAAALARMAGPGVQLPGHQFYERIMIRLGAAARGGLLFSGRAGILQLFRGRLYCFAALPAGYGRPFAGEVPLAPARIECAWGALTLEDAIVPADSGRNLLQQAAGQGIFWIRRGGIPAGAVLRAGQPGQRFSLGQAGHRKLSDMLMASGLPLPWRRSVIVLDDGSGGALGFIVPARPLLSRIDARLYCRAGDEACRMTLERTCLTGGTSDGTV